SIRNDRFDPAVRQVGDVVEAWDVHGAGRRQPQQEGVPSPRAAGELPLANDVGDRADGLLAVAQYRRIDEVCDRLRVERGVPTGNDDRMVFGAVGRVQGDT